MKRVISSIGIILMMVGLASCTFGHTRSESTAIMSATSTEWSAFKRTDMSLEAGQKLIFDYTSTVKSGQLMMKFFDASGNLLIDFGVGTADCCDITIQEDGGYYVLITGDDFDGDYKLSWAIEGL